jgi:hypothetical protein
MDRQEMKDVTGLAWQAELREQFAKVNHHAVQLDCLPSDGRRAWGLGNCPWFLQKNGYQGSLVAGGMLCL